MYYYIVEHARGGREKKWLEQVKLTLMQLGISGEYATPSPARTMDEVVSIGLTKNYATFAVVGSDIFINQAISSIINQYYRFPQRKLAIGFIPSDQDSLIGANLDFKNYETACLALQKRYFIKFSVGLIEPNKFFFSPLAISTETDQKFIVQTDNYEIELMAHAMVIDSELNLTAYSQEKPNFLKKISSFFVAPAEKTAKELSYFQAKKFIIRSEEKPTAIYRANEIIAKTPISVLRLRNLLNVIIKRGKVEEEVKS